MSLAQVPSDDIKYNVYIYRGGKPMTITSTEDLTEYHCCVYVNASEDILNQ